MNLSISSLSTEAAAFDTSSKAGVAMLKKSLDTMETSGKDMIKMMEKSVNPNLGQNIDYAV